MWSSSPPHTGQVISSMLLAPYSPPESSPRSRRASCLWLQRRRRASAVSERVPTRISGPVAHGAVRLQPLARRCTGSLDGVDNRGSRDRASRAVHRLELLPTAGSAHHDLGLSALAPFISGERSPRGSVDDPMHTTRRFFKSPAVDVEDLAVASPSTGYRVTGHRVDLVKLWERWHGPVPPDEKPFVWQALTEAGIADQTPTQRQRTLQDARVVEDIRERWLSLLLDRERTTLKQKLAKEEKHLKKASRSRITPGVIRQNLRQMKWPRSEASLLSRWHGLTPLTSLPEPLGETVAHDLLATFQDATNALCSTWAPGEFIIALPDVDDETLTRSNWGPTGHDLVFPYSGGWSVVSREDAPAVAQLCILLTGAPVAGATPSPHTNESLQRLRGLATRIAKYAQGLKTERALDAVLETMRVEAERKMRHRLARIEALHAGRPYEPPRPAVTTASTHGKWERSTSSGWSESHCKSCGQSISFTGLCGCS